MQLRTPIPNMHYREYTPVIGHKRWIIGADIAVKKDRTSITVLEDVLRPAPRYGRGFVQEFDPPEKTVVQSFRLAKGADYPEIVDILARFSRAPEFEGDAHLFIDATGAGAAVASLLKRKNISFHEVILTSGQGTSEVSHREHRVSKAWLVNHLGAALACGDLKISKNIIDAENLKRELQDYQVQFSQSGQMTFNAKEGSHDDAIISSALALYGSTKVTFGFSSSPLKW